MLSNANAKESKRSQRNSEGRAFGNKTDTKVFTRAAATMPAAKNGIFFLWNFTKFLIKSGVLGQKRIFE